MSAVVLASACGSSTPTVAPTGPSDTASAGATGATPVIVPPDQASLTAGAQAEVDMRHEMWRELDVAKKLGSDGQGVLDRLDGHQTAFGEMVVVVVVVAAW